MRFFRGQGASKIYKYTLRGTEKVRYGEYQHLLDRLQTAGAALALFPIKHMSPPTPETQWMYDFTDGKTLEEVEELVGGVTDVMKMLGEGAENEFSSDGTAEITGRGASITFGQAKYEFPLKEIGELVRVNITDKDGDTFVDTVLQKRCATVEGEELELRLLVEGGDLLASVCTWLLDLRSGQIRMTLKEARYIKIQDLGTALLNQIVEATGAILQA